MIWYILSVVIWYFGNLHFKARVNFFDILSIFIEKQRTPQHLYKAQNDCHRPNLPTTTAIMPVLKNNSTEQTSLPSIPRMEEEVGRLWTKIDDQWLEVDQLGVQGMVVSTIEVQKVTLIMRKCQNVHLIPIQVFTMTLCNLTELCFFCFLIPY